AITNTNVSRRPARTRRSMNDVLNMNRLHENRWLLMPFSTEKAIVASLMPRRRRGLPLLAKRIDGDDPVARWARALVREACLLDELVRQSNDVPGSLQLVHAITGDALFGTRIPPKFGRIACFAIEDVARLRRNRKRVGRRTALAAAVIHRMDDVGIH